MSEKKKTIDEVTARRKYLFENFGMKLNSDRKKAKILPFPNNQSNATAADEYNDLANQHARMKP